MIDVERPAHQQPNVLQCAFELREPGGYPFPAGGVERHPQGRADLHGVEPAAHRFLRVGGRSVNDEVHPPFRKIAGWRLALVRDFAPPARHRIAGDGRVGQAQRVYEFQVRDEVGSNASIHDDCQCIVGDNPAFHVLIRLPSRKVRALSFQEKMRLGPDPGFSERSTWISGQANQGRDSRQREQPADGLFLWRCQPDSLIPLSPVIQKRNHDLYGPTIEHHGQEDKQRTIPGLPRPSRLFARTIPCCPPPPPRCTMPAAAGTASSGQ